MKVTICVGSTCHLLGSRTVVEKFQALVADNHLEDKVELSGKFCMGKCGEGVSVIEWPSRAEEAIPDTYLQVELIPVGDEDRVIQLTPVGGFHPIDVAQMRKEGAMQE